MNYDLESAPIQTQLQIGNEFGDQQIKPVESAKINNVSSVEPEIKLK